MNPVLLPMDMGMLARRVPLHPDDAAQFRETEQKSLQMQGNAFRSEMDRLAAVAYLKREDERRQSQADGPVDQEQSARRATKGAGQYGFHGGSPSGEQMEQWAAWTVSEPDTRNLLLHAMLVPENAIMGTLGAFTERGQTKDRLAKAIPGAFYPPAGYPVEPERERMYESLGPIGGLAADYLMPGPVEAGQGMGQAASRLRYGGGAPVHLIDQFGNEIRRLRNPGWR